MCMDKKLASPFSLNIEFGTPRLSLFSFLNPPPPLPLYRRVQGNNDKAKMEGGKLHGACELQI